MKIFFPCREKAWNVEKRTIKKIKACAFINLKPHETRLQIKTGIYSKQRNEINLSSNAPVYPGF
jgi:hypothetical protein